MMSTSGSSIQPTLRLQGFLRIGVGKLMLLSGACTVLFWAWLFHRENANSDTAVTSFNISQLNHDDPKQRLMGAENLYSVAPKDLTRTVQALAGAIGDSDWKVRRAAASSIVLAIGGCAERRKGEVKDEIDLAAAALLRDFHDRNPEARARVVSAIGNLEIRISNSRNPPRSTSMIQIGPDAKRVLGPLREMMKDTDARVREGAVYSYACVAHANVEEPGPILDVIANDASPVVRTHAIQVLLRIWHDEIDLYPLIIREIKRAETKEERKNAAWLLGNPELSLPTPDLLPSLIDLLTIDDSSVREGVTKFMSMLVDQARPALSALLPIARKEIENDPGLWTVHAMIAIDRDSSETQSLLPSLVPLIHRAEYDHRGDNAMADLMAFGKSAAPVVPLLREALRSSEPHVRSRAVQILGAIGPAAKAALPDLMALLKSETDQSEKEKVEHAMTDIGNR